MVKANFTFNYYLLVRDVWIEVNHKNILGKTDLAICNRGAATLTSLLLKFDKFHSA